MTQDTRFWGGTDRPSVPDIPLGKVKSRNYGDIMYNLPDLTAFRALDEGLLPVEEDADLEPASYEEQTYEYRLFTRRLLGALTRPLTRSSARLDAVPHEYDPTRPEASVDAAFHLRLSGFPYPPRMPKAWALTLLAALPELLPVGRVETYLRVAELIYGRGSRTLRFEDEVRVRGAVTARGVTLEVADAQYPGADTVRTLSIRVDGPASDEFMRLLAALRPAAFTALPVRTGEQPRALITYGELT